MIDHIFEIRSACLRFIDAGQDAIEEKFVTGDEETDSPGPRLAMVQSIRAVTELLAHLDGAFEFSNGQAQEQEDSCLD